MTKNQIHWAWTSIAAIAVAVALGHVGKIVDVSGGSGIALQHAPDAKSVAAVVGHWQSQPYATLEGFALGLDYLFMPLYGFALFFGARVARDTFAPGWFARILAALAFVPLLASMLDAAENALELQMVLNTTVTDGFAALAYCVSTAKWICIFTGLPLWILGAGCFLWERFVKPRSRPAVTES